MNPPEPVSSAAMGRLRLFMLEAFSGETGATLPEEVGVICSRCGAGQQVTEVDGLAGAVEWAAAHRCEVEVSAGG